MAVRPAVPSLSSLLLIVCGALPAQTPLPAKADSIYALRVDPTAHPGLDFVLLLDEGVVRLETDGRSEYTVRQVAQVLTTDGAASWGEFSFWFTPQRERVRINWMRVVGPDGTVLRDGPEHQQETSPTVDQSAPVYSERRAIQATLGAVEPGTIVDYSYTLESLRPHLPGDFRFYWGVNGRTPVRRSRFTLDAPAGLNVPVRERNVGSPAAAGAVAGRRVRTWTFAELPGVKRESYAGYPNKVMQSIVVGGQLSWAQIGAWYQGLLTGRDALTPEILTAHAAQLKGAKTLEDSLRATFRWVAQDFRYVSLALGEGGYQPRPPSEVFRTRFGDCKDKTVLFVSLARRMGVTAYPVLVNSDGVDSLLPSVRQFDHMIAAVVRGGRIEYADATETLVPYGEVPPGLQGEVGLALPAADARVVVLPASLPEHNRYDRETVGRLGLDGRFTGRITLSARGTEQYDLRDAFADIDRQESKVRDERLRGYAQSIYESAVVDSSRYFDGRDLGAAPRVTVWFTATNVIGRVGARYYFNLPLLRFVDGGDVSRIEAEGERRFPIDLAEVNSPSIWRSSLEVELPEGWKADVPADVTVEGAFGYYRATYKQAGQTFRASREMGGRRGLQPPDSAPALRAWFRSVAGDATEMIVMQRGSGRPLSDGGTGDSVSGSTGNLARVLLTLDDLPAGVRISAEGPEKSDDGFLALASTDPIESYERSFAAERMVFTVGSSRISMLQVGAGAHHTAAEAQRPQGLFSLLDLSAFFTLYLEELGAGQVSVGAVRPIDLSGIGDHAKGWMFEVVTPFAPFDMALLMVARHRVSLTVVIMGPKGLSVADVSSLVRKMDQRIQEHAAYLGDVAGDPKEDKTAAADSARRANTPVALDDIVARPAQLAGFTTSSANFGLNNGWPQYWVSVEGRALTFPLNGSGAISIRMDAMLHDTEAQALKRVLYAETGDRRYVFGSILGDTSKMVTHLAAHDSSTIERVAGPTLGGRSIAVLGRMRTLMRMDVDAVLFASGRVSSLVTVSRLPGTGTAGAAAGIARDVRQRMRRHAPQVSAATYPAPLVREVQRVIEAERAVDSLVNARNLDAMFATIDGARLASAPVSFWTGTWHRVCWVASLHGQAARARAACDAAVAPDTTILVSRDARGLNRALAGDLEGAAAEFAYVVEHASPGEFVDKRAAWLKALRAGTNPFTEAVLTELRKP